MILSMVCFSFILSPLCGTNSLNSVKSSGRAARATPSMASSTVLYHKFDTCMKIMYRVAATMIMFNIQNLKGVAHVCRTCSGIPFSQSKSVTPSTVKLAAIWWSLSRHAKCKVCSS